MISMINSLNLIYKGAKKKNKAQNPKPSPVTKGAIKRQKLLIEITTNRPLKVKEISRELGEDLAIIRFDVRSLIHRGLLINLAVNTKSYLVKAA